jgi:hypothetical protein
VDLRIKKIRAALEYGHPPTLTGVQTSQGGGDGGFALAGGGGSDEYGGATGHGFKFCRLNCRQDDNSFWCFRALGK